MRHVRALMLGVALVGLVVACGGYIALGELRASPATTGEPSSSSSSRGPARLRSPPACEPRG